MATKSNLYDEYRTLDSTMGSEQTIPIFINEKRPSRGGTKVRPFFRALEAFRFCTLRGMPIALGGCAMISLLLVATTASPAGPLASKNPKIVEVNLEKAGIDAVIMAPEGSKAEKHYNGSGVRNFDYGFDLELRESKLDAKKQIKDIESNTINKLEKWIEKTDTLLVFESRFSGFSQTEFHFFMLAPIKIKGKTFYCRDQAGSSSKRNEVALMIDACKSLTRSPTVAVRNQSPSTGQ